MNEWAICSPPVAILLFLVLFARRLWVMMNQRRGECEEQREEETEEAIRQHNERIYRDFEFFVKIFIALFGAFGYLRLKEFDGAPQLTREGIKGVALLGLVTMTTLALFIILPSGIEDSQVEGSRMENDLLLAGNLDASVYVRLSGN